MNALALRPSALPDIASAALPATYERAKEALSACQRIDECKDWADKAAALASYAKQADDDTLQKFALRIQSRAIQRCGELLQEFQSPGARTDRQPADGTGGRLTQRQAADAAGMSERQELTAVRVANVPKAEFEAAVESDDPPTVTELAERGTNKQPSKPTPAGFAAATHILGVMHELAAFCATNQPDLVADAVLRHEVQPLHSDIRAVETWLATFLAHLPEVSC